jgi:hypothetical protein
LDGSFVESTELFFRKSNIDIGGIAEFHVVGDFNKDGLEDVIFSMNREDGRVIGPPIDERGNRTFGNMKVFNFSLMSESAGRYRAGTWGDREWHADIYLVDNADGGYDVLETSFTAPTQGWTWEGGWKRVAGYEWVQGGLAFFKRRSPTGGSEQAISSFTNERIGVEARVLTREGWRPFGEFSYANTPVKKICCGQSNETSANFVSIDGKDYVDPSFNFFCTIKRTPSSDTEVIADFSANEIVGGYKGNTVVYGQTELRALDRLFAFGFDASRKLVRNPLVIRNELLTATNFGGFNRMTCADYNDDGYDDILLYRTFGKNTPVIYLNDGKGEFDRVMEGAFPTGFNEFRVQNNYVLTDLNNDKLHDIVYYPIVSERGRSTKITVHFGQRQLSKADLIK